MVQNICTKLVCTTSCRERSHQQANMPKTPSPKGSPKPSSKAKPVEKPASPQGIHKPLSPESRKGLQQQTLKILALVTKRKMPTYHSPGVKADPKTVAEGELLKAQFRERQIPVLRITQRAMEGMEKAKILETMAFLKAQASFYDVELMLTDKGEFFERIAMWKKMLRQQRSKLQSKIDIGTTLELDSLYTRSVTNESNIYKGRNSLNDVE